MVELVPQTQVKIPWHHSEPISGIPDKAYGAPPGVEPLPWPVAFEKGNRSIWVMLANTSRKVRDICPGEVVATLEAVAFKEAATKEGTVTFQGGGWWVLS